MAKGRFEDYGEDADRECRAAVEDAENTILGSYELDRMPSVDTAPANPTTMKNWFETNPAGFDPDELVVIAGQTLGWYQVQAVMARRRFKDPEWYGSVRKLVISAADTDGDIGLHPLDLSEDQLARVAVSLALLQYGIQTGQHVALQGENIDKAKTPKDPKLRMQWLGKAGVASAAMAGLIIPGGFEATLTGFTLAGGAQLFQEFGVEGAHRQQVKSTRRRVSDVERHNTVVAALEKIRDCDDPAEHITEAALRYLRSVDYMQSKRRSLEKSVDGILATANEMDLDPQAPAKSAEGEDDKAYRKGVWKRIGATAVVGALFAVSGVAIKHIAEDGDKPQRKAPSGVSGNTPATTAPLNQSEDLSFQCRQLPDNDNNPRTPKTIPYRSRVETCPAGS